MIYFARNRYGHQTLVQLLMWNLIVNLTYYQYQSDEVYLFARLFFGDLPQDMLLFYLELHRITKIAPDSKQ